MDVRAILDYLESATFRTFVDQGQCSLYSPLTEDQIAFAAQELAHEIRPEIRALLRCAGGIAFHPPAEPRPNWCESHAVVGLSFCPGDDGIWSSAYPGSCPGGIGEELLYWDIAGDPPGGVFAVFHDGPEHGLVYRDLTTFIKDIATTEPEDCFDHVYRMTQTRVSYPRVDEFRAADPDLEAFLAEVPGHYLVYDLRGAGPGAAFPYGAWGPTGLRRWENRYLWVDRTPGSWLEALRCWWRGPG